MKLFPQPLLRAAFFSLLFAPLPAWTAPDFHSDVAPILRDYCSACHSGKETEGELNLETFASLKKGGESGTPLPKLGEANSLLQKVIRGSKPAMPPKKEPQPTEADLQVLEAWLKAGAPGPTAPDVSILTLVTVPQLPLKVKESRAITAATTSDDARFVAVARFRTVEVLDAKTRAVLHKFDGLPGKVTSLHFNKDATRLAAASGVAGISGSARVWTLAHANAGGAPTAPATLILEGSHSDLVYSVRWSPDGKQIATGGYDAKIVLWDAATGQAIRSLKGHNGAVFDVAFHPDGKLLASASGDQTVKIWRLPDGERLDTLKEPQGEQFNVAFTPDGTGILAAGADRRVRLWKLVSREKVEINPMLESRFAHEATIHSMHLLRDGKRLVTAALDRSLKVWSLPSLELLSVFPQQPDTLTAVQSLPGTDTLLVARMNGSLDALPIPNVAPPAPATQAQHAALGIAPNDSKPLAQIEEMEPNNSGVEAQKVSFPLEIKGEIATPGDVDTFRFEAKAGEQWTFEVIAEREKSTLDSRLEVRGASGKPVERVVLQATRSSWLTFRGKDSLGSGDFRVQNATEMELNEFLYCNGEVVKLWMYPRGPDSGFIVYPGQGNRQNYFDTTPLSHPLGQPVYTVRPFPPGSQPPPNGLPLFRLNFENDDDSSRAAGRDSVLHFTAPADGTYQVRLTDTRGFGADTAFYRLVGRRSQPDFSVSITTGQKPTVSPGSGREFQVTAVRKDGFDGPIRVDLEDLPPDFTASTPLIIEAGQHFALGALYANPGLTKPTPEVAARTKLRATASIQGREVSHTSPGLGEIKVGPAPKLTITVAVPPTAGATGGQPPELVVHPGETITAKIRASRIDFKDRIELGGDDSGRNLPHGVYVDNVGLNGLLIPEGQTEREFSITAAKWVPESRRLIFFRAKGDGGQVSPAVWLTVRTAL